MRKTQQWTTTMDEITRAKYRGVLKTVKAIYRKRPMPRRVTRWIAGGSVGCLKRLVECHAMFTNLGAGWVDPSGTDMFNEFLFDGSVHARSEQATVRALAKTPKDSTSTYLRDMAGLYLRAVGVRLEYNFVSPYDACGNGEILHLKHGGEHRPDYSYYKPALIDPTSSPLSRHGWNYLIDPDIESYHRYREGLY